ncbi:MAG: hypothetical protein ABIL39_11840 [candidate division WOR-3 bacterium]
METVKFIRSVLVILMLLNVSCLIPTFDSPIVRKGMQGWVGVTGGYRCFDYGVIDEYNFEDTKGVAVAGGLFYGFSDKIGLSSNFTVYRIEGYRDGTTYQIHNRFSASIAPKIELRKNRNPTLSVALGPAFPDIIRGTLMVGFRDETRNTLYTLGTHITYFAFFKPYDFFVNIGPGEGSGIVFYLGYQLPYWDNPQNFGVGLGYRFR